MRQSYCVKGIKKQRKYRTFCESLFCFLLAMDALRRFFLDEMMHYGRSIIEGNICVMFNALRYALIVNRGYIAFDTHII